MNYNWETVRKKVEKTAVARKQSKVLRSEADYFAGAMAALEALTGESPNTYWVMSILTGRSIVKEAMKEAIHETF